MNSDTDTELRRSAEARLQDKSTPADALSVEDTKKMLHELQVHQIELQMQNESLCEARSAEEQALYRYTELFDFAPMGYFALYPSSEITQVNLRGASLLGLERLNLIGRLFFNYVTHEHQVTFSDFLAKAFETGDKQNCEILVQVGKHTLWLSLEANIGVTEMDCLVAMVDITDRKQAEAELQKADALQSAIFNSANFSSIATDAKGVIQIFNVGAERMLGYAAEDVMNKVTPAEISDAREVIERAAALSIEFDTPIAAGFEALIYKASRGIEDIYELTYIRKDGSRFPAIVSVTALRDAQDVIIGYLLICTNNTARE